LGGGRITKEGVWSHCHIRGASAASEGGGGAAQEREEQQGEYHKSVQGKLRRKKPTNLQRKRKKVWAEGEKKKSKNFSKKGRF